MRYLRGLGTTLILNVSELTDEELAQITAEVYAEKTLRTAAKVAAKIYPEPTPLELGTAMFVNMTTGSEMYRDRTGLSQVTSFQVLSLVKDQVNKELIAERISFGFKKE